MKITIDTDILIKNIFVIKILNNDSDNFINNINIQNKKFFYVKFLYF